MLEKTISDHGCIPLIQIPVIPTPTIAIQLIPTIAFLNHFFNLPFSWCMLAIFIA
jgi:hypothetical protein